MAGYQYTIFVHVCVPGLGIIANHNLCHRFCVQTRRSMVFAKHLRLIGDDFRAKYLNSSDDRDLTVYSEDWTRMKVRDCFVDVLILLKCNHLLCVCYVNFHFLFQCFFVIYICFKHFYIIFKLAF